MSGPVPPATGPESERPPRARLFVALDLPEVVRRELVRWQQDVLRGDEALRLIAPEALHVTLAFLGWRDEGEIKRIAGLAMGCAAPVHALATDAVCGLPARRPRVVAMDLRDEEGTLGALQACVCNALASHAGYEPDARRFRPHVTLARVRKGSALPRETAAEGVPRLRFDGAALTLYRSRLGRAEASYEALARANL